MQTPRSVPMGILAFPYRCHRCRDFAMTCIHEIRDQHQRVMAKLRHLVLDRKSRREPNFPKSYGFTSLIFSLVRSWQTSWTRCLFTLLDRSVHLFTCSLWTLLRLLSIYNWRALQTKSSLERVLRLNKIFCHNATSVFSIFISTRSKSNIFVYNSLLD